MSDCIDCGVSLSNIFYVRCRHCSSKKTEKRKYKRRHMHRQKLGGLIK